MEVKEKKIKLKMEQTNYKENKVNQGHKTQTNSVE